MKLYPSNWCLSHEIGKNNEQVLFNGAHGSFDQSPTHSTGTHIIDLTIDRLSTTMNFALLYKLLITDHTVSFS